MWATFWPTMAKKHLYFGFFLAQITPTWEPWLPRRSTFENKEGIFPEEEEIKLLYKPLFLSRSNGPWLPTTLTFFSRKRVSFPFLFLPTVDHNLIQQEKETRTYFVQNLAKLSHFQSKKRILRQLIKSKLVQWERTLCFSCSNNSNSYNSYTFFKEVKIKGWCWRERPHRRF